MPACISSLLLILKTTNCSLWKPFSTMLRFWISTMEMYVYSPVLVDCVGLWIRYYFPFWSGKLCVLLFIAVGLLRFEWAVYSWRVEWDEQERSFTIGYGAGQVGARDSSSFIVQSHQQSQAVLLSHVYSSSFHIVNLWIKDCFVWFFIIQKKTC